MVVLGLGVWRAHGIASIDLLGNLPHVFSQVAFSLFEEIHAVSNQLWGGFVWSFLLQMILYDDAIVIVSKLLLKYIDSFQQPGCGFARRGLSQLQQVEKSLGSFAPNVKLCGIITLKRPFPRLFSGMKCLRHAVRGCRPSGVGLNVR